MRKLVLLAVAIVLALAPAAWAADDGNTQLKLSSGTFYIGNGYVDIVNTSGTGNVKGIRCTNISLPFTIELTVNGGTTQSITTFGDAAPDSGWVPMNIRFTSSIHVKAVNGSQSQTNGTVLCQVAWGLD